MVHLFLNGGAMRGGPLHAQLDGAPLVAETVSAPLYRFYSVRGEFPGMDPAGDLGRGRAVTGELYDVPLDVLHDSLLPSEPAELELGAIRLADGRATLAMVLREAFRGSPDLTDISDIGSWNQYQEASQ